MATRLLSKIESHLVLLAVRQHESTVEAANVAFNHAVRPIVETVNIKQGTIPDLHARGDGLIEMTWEEAPAFDENGMGPREALVFSHRMKAKRAEEDDASSG